MPLASFKRTAFVSAKRRPAEEARRELGMSMARGCWPCAMKRRLGALNLTAARTLAQPRDLALGGLKRRRELSINFRGKDISHGAN
jgi:hypothetical protein